MKTGIGVTVLDADGIQGFWVLNLGFFEFLDLADYGFKVELNP